MIRNVWDLSVHGTLKSTDSQGVLDADSNTITFGYPSNFTLHLSLLNARGQKQIYLF